MTDAEGTLDDLYLEWLYGLFGSVRNLNPERGYWCVARQLYSKEFTWFVHNDENRVEDGKELRLEFVRKTRFSFEDDRDFVMWLELPCSMLEMIIALARHTAFEADSTALDWFWRFMHNMGIDKYTDDIYEISIQEEVEESIDRVIQRTYERDGTGGLFPLRSSRSDQRRVELWYQKEAYLLEGLYVNTRPTV